jgi:hypothetical protein
MAAVTYTWTGETYGATGYESKTYTVEGPLYHGGGRSLRGGELTPGRRTNDWGDEGEVSRFVHFTTRLDVAAEYARLSGGHVFEVEPTGDFRMGYSGDEYKSEYPVRIVRTLDPSEWEA